VERSRLHLESGSVLGLDSCSGAQEFSAAVYGRNSCTGWELRVLVSASGRCSEVRGDMDYWRGEVLLGLNVVSCSSAVQRLCVGRGGDTDFDRV
jgi:hypothetical protein